MEIKNYKYEVRMMSNNYNLNNYRGMYSNLSSGERNYINSVKYAPKTGNPGNYLPLM